MYEFISKNFRGATILIITRSGAIAFGEVIDGAFPNVISVLGFGLTQYVNASAIDMFF